MKILLTAINAINPTIIITTISNIFSEPKLFLFIKHITYHNEFSDTFLDTKLAKHRIIILIMELNNPIAVAYEN